MPVGEQAGHVSPEPIIDYLAGKLAGGRVCDQHANTIRVDTVDKGYSVARVGVSAVVVGAEATLDPMQFRITVGRPDNPLDTDAADRGTPVMSTQTQIQLEPEGDNSSTASGSRIASEHSNKSL